MKIKINLFASLVRYMPKDKKNLQKNSLEITCRNNISINELLKDLKIPEKDVKLMFINNRHAKKDTLLKQGDKVGLFPPIGGG